VLMCRGIHKTLSGSANTQNRRAVKLAFVLAGTLALANLAIAADASTGPARPYAVVVSQATSSQPQWQAVVDALKAKHNAVVVTYAGNVGAAQWELSAHMPDYVCFVARPEEAGRSFVVRVSRMMRELDADPYTDAVWGIVTGYDPADALRIAKTSEPLLVKQGGSGAGPGVLGGLDNSFASSEGSLHSFWTIKDGNAVDEKVDPDPTRRLAECLNTMAPQVFFTSGHATEKDWQVGYNIKAGQFRCDNGQLYALTSRNKRLDINSPSTKVYLPMGNCLIGHISERDCMTLAWMHTGGVNQMFGYTAVTFFGYMGWGTKDYFCSGRYNLAEAFFLNNQALVRDLREKFPAQADIRFNTYDHRAVQYLAAKHKLNRDSLGLLWDRDVVAFYGDPAWEARMTAGEPAWKEQFATASDGTVTLTITCLTDGADWPKHGILAFAPMRLADIEIVTGAELKPVVTDNFVLVCPPGKVQKDHKIVISYKGKPVTRPDTAVLDQLTNARKIAAEYPNEAAVFQALALAGESRQSLLSMLGEAPEQVRPELSFLLTNMTTADMRAVSGPMLLENATLAHQAWLKAPWRKDTPTELYFNDVLPYALLNETRDAWRKDFVDRFAERAWQCKTAGEAAVFLNRTIFKELKVRYSKTNRPKPNQSPRESIEAGFASCTGLSIMLADACRACGIPARVAGIQAWKDGQGDANGNHGSNHCWVEVWSGGEWHHLDAAASTELDRAWFTGKTAGAAVDGSMRQHSIFASSFRRIGTAFPMAWAPDDVSVPAVNVTQSYKNRPATKPATAPATRPATTTAPAGSAAK